MARIVDVRCVNADCREVQNDVFCSQGQEPVCTTCGSATAVYFGDWANSSLRKADNFTPLDFEGVHYNTREEWNAMVARVQATHPGEEVRVEAASRHSRRARADDVRHAGWLERKKYGIDNPKQLAEFHRDTGARR